MIKITFFILMSLIGVMSEAEVQSTTSICDCGEGITKREVVNDDDVDFRIVGGQNTKPHEFPQICRLVHEKITCGCTIINSEYVLTAAHCIRDFEISKFRIIVEKYNFDEVEEPNVKFLAVKDVIKHHKYELNERTVANDIAVVHLDSSIVFNNDIQPSCLPLKFKNYDNQVLTAVGWGQKRETNQPTDEDIALILQKVNLPTVPLEQCKEDYRDKYAITESQICAGYSEGGKDTCTGDSGGPLFLMTSNPPEQVGVVSFGIGCARPGKPGVYTNVGYYADFIFNNTKVTNGCQIYSRDKS